MCQPVCAREVHSSWSGAASGSRHHVDVVERQSGLMALLSL